MAQDASRAFAREEDLVDSSDSQSEDSWSVTSHGCHFLVRKHFKRCTGLLTRQTRGSTEANHQFNPPVAHQPEQPVDNRQVLGAAPSWRTFGLQALQRCNRLLSGRAGSITLAGHHAHEFEQHRYLPVEQDRAGAAPVVRATLTLDS